MTSPARNTFSLARARSILDQAEAGPLLRGFKWLGVFLALALVVFSRHWLNPDYMSYLDVGEAWLRGDFEHAVNGYWNPVFPIIAAAVASLFPDNSWDPLAGHLVSFALFIASQAVFHWLLRQVQEFISGEPHPSRELVLMAYPLFLWCALILTSPKSMHVDALVGMALMWASGIILRILNRGATARRFAAFGLALGLGYLTKIVMLSISACFLICAVAFLRPFRRVVAFTALSGLILAAINAPHVAYLSKIKGRLDLGDTGSLAYAWLVNGVSPLFHWTGEPPGFGTPAHPPRKILADPEVFDYSSYPHGTYPPGYDPSYWNEGLKPKPNLPDQIKAIRAGLEIYARILLKPAPLLALAALLICWRQSSRRAFFASFAKVLPIFLPAVAGLALYLLVLVDDRYVGYLLLISFISLIAAVLRSKEETPLPRAFTFVCLANVLILCAMLGREALAASFGNTQRIFRDHAAVAGVLRQHLKPGDAIGVLGNACWASYARLAEVKILAEGCTHHSSDAWLADAVKRENALEAMRPLDLRAIVLEAAPGDLDTNRWLKVPGANYSILILTNAPQGASPATR